MLRWERLGDIVVLPISSFDDPAWDTIGEELWSAVAKSLGARRLARQVNCSLFMLKSIKDLLVTWMRICLGKILFILLSKGNILSLPLTVRHNVLLHIYAIAGSL